MTNEMEDRALPFPAYFPAESGSGRLGPLTTPVLIVVFAASSSSTRDLRTFHFNRFT